jgi:hypothetical protein
MEKLVTNDVYTIKEDEDGYITHYKKGRIHRNERDEYGALLPAEYTRSGSNCLWLQNGWFVRENDLPHEFYEDEDERILFWLTPTGTEHRTTTDSNGELLPAKITYSKVDGITTKEYRNLGTLRHARAGPAIVRSNGEVYWYTKEVGLVDYNPLLVRPSSPEPSSPEPESTN